jgi:peptidoglycan/LPS O-acetylase OafA/YrhL
MSQDVGTAGRSPDASAREAASVEAVSNSNPDKVSLFKGIEGARAWLAWSVVGTHTALFTGLTMVVPHGSWLHVPGDDAVKVFIIISGFVITHLILTKHEPYGLYIARRFLRIFPAYLVSLALAILVAPLSFDAVEAYKYTEPYQHQDFLTLAQQYHHNLWEHVVAHLLLLQGAVSNAVLPDSQIMFLPAAWSLSLEWQFYLLAPAWIFALIRFPIVTVAATLGIWLFWYKFLSDSYGLPSFLPGAGIYFLVGMGSRLLIKHLPKLDGYPFALVIASSALVLLSKNLAPLVIWVALLAYFQQPRNWAVLDSPLARAAGARSYSVYILHIPFIFLGLYLSVRILGLSLWPTVGLTAAVAVLGTLIGSELVFRYIETPAINFARSLGKRRAPISPGAEASGW